MITVDGGTKATKTVIHHNQDLSNLLTPRKLGEYSPFTVFALPPFLYTPFQQAIFN